MYIYNLKLRHMKKWKALKKHKNITLFIFFALSLSLSLYIYILLRLIIVSYIYHFYISKRYLKTRYYCPFIPSPYKHPFITLPFLLNWNCLALWGNFSSLETKHFTIYIFFQIAFFSGVPKENSLLLFPKYPGL